MSSTPTTPAETYAAQYTGDNVMKNVPLASGAYKTFTDAFQKLPADFSKGDGEAVATDITSTAADATGFAADAVSAATDPLNFLISKGLAFLENVFSPLKEELQLVTGNPDVLSSCAQKFDGVANSLNQLAGQVQQTALAGGQNWQGDAAANAGTQLNATKQSITDTATAAGHIASLLQISSMLMQAAYDIINGIIAGVVEYVVVTWIAAQAAAVVTLGGSEAAAMGLTVGEVGVGTEQAASKTEEASSILTKIMNLLKKIIGKLKEIGLGKFMREEKKVGETVVQKAGAGAKSLKDIETEGKTAGQIFDEAMSKNLGKKIADTARDKALAEIGLPGKSKLDDPGSMTTLEAVQAGANLVNKDWGWGDKAGKAVDYATDPGAYSQYKDSTSATSSSAPASIQPPSPQPGPAPTQPPSGGGIEPIPNWPTGEPEDGNVEPI